jgi:hypothetical protein
MYSGADCHGSGAIVESAQWPHYSICFFLLVASFPDITQPPRAAEAAYSWCAQPHLGQGVGVGSVVADGLLGRAVTSGRGWWWPALALVPRSVPPSLAYLLAHQTFD